jgi:DNA modification methylase
VSAAIIRGNALHLPLADESVDLICTSPPYFSLRSYRDNGAHYSGQIGSEPTPQEFLESLWAVMRECWRVLKPTGSCWVNLGDKRSGSGGHNNSNLARLHQNYGRPPTERHALADDGHRALRRNAPDRYNQAAFGRPKSKMLLPHRFAIGCEDGLADPEGIGWIVRQDQVQHKLNGLPESVTDRTRDSHEFWFHLTKSERYYSAVDEVREPHAMALSYKRLGQENAAGIAAPRATARGEGDGRAYATTWSNPLGKLPSSVWAVASEPLTIPEWAKARYDLPDHFAAFPQELPRRIILGWSPGGVCVECGEGRRPVVAKELRVTRGKAGGMTARDLETSNDSAGARDWSLGAYGHYDATIVGYSCACLLCRDCCERLADVTNQVVPAPQRRVGVGPQESCVHCRPAPTRPAIVLDPFVGTGTTIGVAQALGRTGIGVDLSMDYARLAQWFTQGDGRRRFAKTTTRTDAERQGALL